MDKENCKKCIEVNKKYTSNENWNVLCPECAKKQIKILIENEFKK